MDIAITHDEGHRFEATIDGAHAGLLDYRLDGSVATMPHTAVDPHFEGRGVGSALVAAAVGVARDRGWSIRPTCSFVAEWLDRHPAEQELIHSP